MAAKKKGKGKKGKKKGPPPPPKDKGWEKAVQRGVWERPLEALPDQSLHPSFKDIKEKIFTSLEKLATHWSDIVTANEFAEELFAATRPRLTTLELRGTRYLTKVVLSPVDILPSLKVLDLSCCENLEYVLIQCNTLETLNLHFCENLKKTILHTKKLKEVDLVKCPKLQLLILWSDTLEQLELPNHKINTCQLHCPVLTNIINPQPKAPLSDF